MNGIETPLPAAGGLLSRLTERDRERLGEALRRLVAHGSILGSEPSQLELYSWCHQNRAWTEDAAGLLDLKLYWEHESRLVQAVPQTGVFLLRLKLDATLVLLTLWYEFDMAVRDRGETPPVRLTVEQLNEALLAKFEPLEKHLPGASRLREILALAQRKNLVRFEAATEFAKTQIDILPTLKRIIPFQSLTEWTQYSERHLAAVRGLATEAEAEPDNE